MVDSIYIRVFPEYAFIYVGMLNSTSFMVEMLTWKEAMKMIACLKPNIVTVKGSN